MSFSSFWPLLKVNEEKKEKKIKKKQRKPNPNPTLPAEPYVAYSLDSQRQQPETKSK